MIVRIAYLIFQIIDDTWQRAVLARSSAMRIVGSLSDVLVRQSTLERCVLL